MVCYTFLGPVEFSTQQSTVIYNSVLEAASLITVYSPLIWFTILDTVSLLRANSPLIWHTVLGPVNSCIFNHTLLAQPDELSWQLPGTRGYLTYTGATILRCVAKENYLLNVLDHVGRSESPPQVTGRGRVLRCLGE